MLEILVTPCESISQFLNDVCSGIVQSDGVNRHTTELWIILEHLHEFRSDVKDRSSILTLHYHLLDWVPTDRTNNKILVVALLLEVFNKNLCQLQRAARTSLEVHFNDVATNVLEQFLDKFSTYKVAWNLESQRVNALVQDVKCLCICLFRVFSNDVLTHIPCIVLLLVATYEGEFSGQRIRCFHLQHVLAAIERLHIEAFISSPYQSLVLK